MHVRGLTAALNATGRYKYKAPDSVVDHLIIGGGVVGLAIAARLTQRFPDKTTYLVERHARVGEETSARNSEVIHSGIYYPADSLKTRLCLRGRALLYAYCAARGVPHQRTGKLVLARAHQRAYLESLHAKASALRAQVPPGDDNKDDARAAPTELLSGAEARALEPDLHGAIAAALWSPATGIVDAHALLAALERDVGEAEAGNGAVVLGTRVVRVDPHARSAQAAGAPDAVSAEDGWVVQMVTGGAETDDDGAGTGDAVLARTLVNASGLSGALVLNALLPPAERIAMYYARGSYASYRGPGAARVRRLLYPVPDASGPRGHAFQSLGTHLTLDLAGNVRFGPDLEWLDPPRGDGADPDWWAAHLAASDARTDAMYAAVADYLPGVRREGFQPDYAGIRPKLVAPPQGSFQDFVIRRDYAADFLRTYPKADGAGAMITLLGIESPGLTSNLAIAELVVDGMLSNGR